MGEPGVLPLAVSMGEPAGIGPDLILKLYAEREALKLPPFAVYGNVAFLAARARRLGIDVPFVATSASQATPSPAPAAAW